jgi:hypothetical protein
MTPGHATHQSQHRDGRDRPPSPQRHSAPTSLDAALHLQLTIGNYAATELLRSLRPHATSIDVHEQEADRIGRQIMHAPTGALPETGLAHNHTFLDTNGLLPQVAAPVRTQDHSTAGSGDVLPAELLTFFGERFGFNFSGVRIHTGAGAAKAADGMGATAYTVGSDIVFGEGVYQPNTEAGKQVLGHELTHVVQQSPCPAGVPVMHTGGPVMQRIPALPDRPPGQILDAELHAKIDEIRGWLEKNPVNSFENTQLAEALELLEAEARERARRREGKQQTAELLHSLGLQPPAPRFVPPARKREERVAEAERLAQSAEATVGHRESLAAAAPGPREQALARQKAEDAARTRAKSVEALPGDYTQYSQDPNYIDNFETSSYDAMSKEMRLFFKDGTELIIPMTSLTGAFSGPPVITNSASRDKVSGKISPDRFSDESTPRISRMLRDAKEVMGQADILAELGPHLPVWGAPPDEVAGPALVLLFLARRYPAFAARGRRATAASAPRKSSWAGRTIRAGVASGVIGLEEGTGLGKGGSRAPEGRPTPDPVADVAAAKQPSGPPAPERPASGAVPIVPEPGGRPRGFITGYRAPASPPPVKAADVSTANEPVTPGGPSPGADPTLPSSAVKPPTVQGAQAHWELGWQDRGLTVESAMGKMYERMGPKRRMPKGFKGVDYVSGGRTTVGVDAKGRRLETIEGAMLISEKTIDIRGDSVKTSKQMEGAIKKHINALFEFEGRRQQGLEVRESADKVLNVYIGPGEPSVAQQVGIQEAIEHAKVNKIAINIVRF